MLVSGDSRSGSAYHGMVYSPRWAGYAWNAHGEISNILKCVVIQNEKEQIKASLKSFISCVIVEEPSISSCNIIYLQYCDFTL